MPFITVAAQPKWKQLTWDDIMFTDMNRSDYVCDTTTGTVTRWKATTPKSVLDQYDFTSMVRKLTEFNDKYHDLFDVDRNSLYHTYFIPKRSGGRRQIDEPLPALMSSLRELKDIFERDFRVLYHTSAFAYVRHRSTIDAVRKHQANKSWWFVKFDFHNFFGSTTQEFVMKMFEMVFPFSEIIQCDGGRSALERALSLCFLNGGLPQGTPISPLLTNTMMIPIDHRFNNKLESFGEENYVYTRYADDILISSRSSFDYKAVQNEIVNVLQSVGAPFQLNAKKTRYGSRAGSNFNLGVCLNKDNEITVGWENRKKFKSMLNNYLYDRMRNIKWQRDQVTHMNGLISYYNMIDKEWTQNALCVYNTKFMTNVKSCIKQDLKS